MENRHFAPAWTFADLLSGYRFWALLGATIAVICAVVAFNQYVGSLVRVSETLPFGARSIWTYFVLAGGLAGFALGLCLARSRTAMPLLICAGVGALNCTLLRLFDEGIGLAAICAAVFIGQSLSAAFSLVLTSVAAGAVSGRAACANVIGIQSVFLMVSMQSTSFGLSSSSFHYGADIYPLFAIGAMCLAVALLAPLRGVLQPEPPARVHVLRPPVPRDGVNVALLTSLPWLALLVLAVVLSTSGGFGRVVSTLALCLLVFLGVAFTALWFYRVHGELASLLPSAQLFTSRAALLVYLLVPFAMPILLLTLDEVLCEAAENRGVPARHSRFWFSFWCFVLPPAAAGAVQERLNALCAGHTESQGGQ